MSPALARFRVGLRRVWDDPSWHPDAARALRCTVAFMGPLLLAPVFHWAQATATLAAIAGESLALIELRGPYSLRLMLFSGMALVFGAVAWAGAASAPSVLGAVIAMGVIAALAGVWRKLNSDFGLSLGISSCVLFLIALAYPPAAAPAWISGRAALLGGLFSAGVQVAMWPIRAQQPLRRLVGESWNALALLLAALGLHLSRTRDEGPQALTRAEADLRAALDRTSGTLAAAKAGRRRPVIERLEALNLAAARLGTRAGALGAALEPMRDRPAFDHFAATLAAVLETLDHLAQAVARAVITRHPGHLLLANLRLRRAAHLLDALRTRLRAQDLDAQERETLLEILRPLRALLPDLRKRLRDTVDRADERAAFPLELPEVSAPSRRPLVAALDLRGRIDPALLRYTARITVLMMCGVGLYRGLDLPRGYWLPLTIIVVLQPDYGATRKKVGLRILGTTAGLIAASALLRLRIPPHLILATVAASLACFAFWVRRSYALAVFFVTLMLGLLLTLGGTPTLTFALERLASTLAGGGIALAAALLFWPAWERTRLPSILAQALRTKRAYLEHVAERLAAGAAYDASTVAAKRAAERADGQVFASLERMYGDPQNQQERIEALAALANGNQRLTRILNTLLVGLRAAPPEADPALAALVAGAGQALEALAAGVESGVTDQAALDAALHTLGALRWTSAASPGLAGPQRQLRRVNTEVIALCAAARSESPSINPLR